MQVSIYFLHRMEELRKKLNRDGWHLQADDESGEMRARHPEVSDEKVARQRLNDIGLLTSRECRIEFLPYSQRRSVQGLADS
jgi:hypothetical protein